MPQMFPSYHLAIYLMVVFYFLLFLSSVYWQSLSFLQKEEKVVLYNQKKTNFTW